MKKKLNFNLSFKKLTTNYSILLWSLLVIVILCVGFKLKFSFNVIAQVIKPEVITIPNGGARVNFQNYDEVVKRIQTGGDYQPTKNSDVDPFSVSISKSQSTAQ